MISRALIIKDGKILLIHRIKQGKEYYTLPGGHIEPGETQEETLIREIREETGLSIHIEQKLWDVKNPYDDAMHHFFLVRSFSGKLVLGSPEKQRNSLSNQYILEWHPLNRLSSMSIVPDIVKNKIIGLL